MQLLEAPPRRRLAETSWPAAVKPVTAKVTVGVINYNGRSTLPETLSSIHGLDVPVEAVILVDNQSTDGSLEWVQRHHPEVFVYSLDQNRGSAAARNVVLQLATTAYVFVVDNDMVLQPDTLARLLQVMQRVPQVAVCHPDIRDRRDPRLGFHYNGGRIHYLCTHIARPHANGSRPEYEPFDVVSGGALLLKRQPALEIGGFDEDFFFNWEDGDFTARMTLAGHLCVNVPDAVAFHPYRPRGTAKVFYQVRNRWYFILKLYAWRTLLLILPMLILFEVAQAILVLMNGAFVDYWRGTGATLRALPALMRKRAAFQRMKIRGDREWLHSGEIFIPESLLHNTRQVALAKMAGACFDAYWRVVRRLC